MPSASISGPLNGTLHIFLVDLYRHHIYIVDVEFRFVPASLVEPRKIQVLGGSTYTVSIPKRWVDRLGIEPGDFVSLQLTKDGHLLIRSKSAPQPVEKRGTLDPSGLSPDEIHQRLLGLYLAGFKRIEVHRDPKIAPEAMSAIRDLSRSVSGLELVQETQSTAILEDIIDPTRFSMKMALERMYALLRSSMVRIVDGFLGKDTVGLTESLAKLEDVERLSWIVMKQHRMIAEEPVLALDLNLDVADSPAYALTAQHLKAMAWTCRDILDMLAELDKLKVPRSALLECVEIGNSVISMSDKGLFAFTRGDLRSATDCISSLPILEERINEVREFVAKPAKGKLGCAACLAVGNVLELLRRMARLVTTVAEISFQGSTTQK